MTDPALALREVALPTRGVGPVSLTVPRGGRLMLLGESGGGKSTLLRFANRLVEPAAGEVEVLGRPVDAWEIAALRRAVTLVVQAPVRFGGSVADELQRPLAWHGRPSATPAALRAALEVAGLPELELEHPGAELSGGEQTRLGLARAVLLAPPLLLLDEPTGALDVRTARELLARLRSWSEAAGVTLVCVTHRPEDAAALEADAAYLLEGRLHGPFPAGAEVDDAVQAFLGAQASA